MDEKEFQAQMERIYAYNRRNQQRDERLKKAEKKLQNIWSLLPDPSDIPTLPELMKMLSSIRKMREDGAE